MSPAYFISAEEDELIGHSHAKRLYERYKGEKRYKLVKGKHNTIREDFVNDSIAIFFYNCFGLDIKHGNPATQRDERLPTLPEPGLEEVTTMTEDEVMAYVMKLSKEQK